MKRRIYGEENELGAVSTGPGKESPYHLRELKDVPYPYIYYVDTSVLELGTFLQERLDAVGGFQPNGGRISQDMSHIEVGSPEATLARDLVLATKGQDLLVEELFRHPEGDIVLIKDNTDSATDEIALGCHENYLYYDPDYNIGVPYREIAVHPNLGLNQKFIANFMLLLISRIPLFGGGVISMRKEDRGEFYLSHRARCIKTIFGSARERPIIDLDKENLIGHNAVFQRRHISFGDPLMAEVPEYLKYGFTAELFMRLAEDGFLPFPEDARVVEPLKTIQAINKDFTFKKPLIVLKNGKKFSAVEVLRQFLETSIEHYPEADDPPDIAEETLDIQRRMAEILDNLENNPGSLYKTLDHSILYTLMNRKTNREEGIELWELPDFIKNEPERGEALLINLKYYEQRYHELSPKSIYRMLCGRNLVERILTDQEIEIHKREPPGLNNLEARCRSWARGKIVQWARERGRSISAYDWRRITIRNGGYHTIELHQPFEWREPLKELSNLEA